MRQVLLLRFGEVHLKGQNRPYFLRMLVENVRKAVSDTGGRVWLSDSRIYVSGARDIGECAELCKKVFGIHSVSVAMELEKRAEDIFEECARQMENAQGTFKVMCKRSDKTFPLNSQELACEAGARVLKAHPRLKVDVHKPQTELWIEIRDHAYVYSGEIMGVGGLPTGVSGRAALLLSGGIDSPVAGYQIMRRGVSVEAVHFASPPYTSERAKEKVLALARIVGAYQSGMRVHIVPFTDIQMQIHEKCESGLTTIIMRRFMMRIAARLARENKCQALITGESLGQVASQTMEALCLTDGVIQMPVFRPLIGLDKLDIIHVAEAIDTYETSILPYEDCCTVFTPRHPVTRPKRAQVENAERALNIDALVDEAARGTQVYFVNGDSVTLKRDGAERAEE